MGLGLALFFTGCRAKQAGPYAYSSKVDYYDAGRFEKPRKFEPLALYTYNPNHFLVGNQCVTEYTKTLGFEYTYPFDAPNSKPNRLYTFFHNAYANIRLTGRLGLRWKKKVKERIRQCRESSGDYRS